MKRVSGQRPAPTYRITSVLITVALAVACTYGVIAICLSVKG